MTAVGGKEGRTARDVLLYRLTRHASADSAQRLLAEYDELHAAEVLAAAAPPPLTPEREQKVHAALYGDVHEVLVALGVEGRVPSLRFSESRHIVADHVSARLLPDVLHAERFIASHAANLTDQEAKRVALERELAACQAGRDAFAREFGDAAKRAVAKARVESRAAALADAVAAARSEYLTDNTGSETDDAYQRGVADAVAAIGRLVEAGAERGDGS